MSMTSSYERTINAITSEIEALESQIKPLEQQKQKLLQFRRELVNEKEEVQKQEFIETNGVTKCPETGKSSKPKKQNGSKGGKTQFDALKELLAGMTDEEKRQLLDQYSDSGSDNPKENGDDESQGINIE